jgi:hypothetical protein
VGSALQVVVGVASVARRVGRKIRFTVFPSRLVQVD